MSKKRILSGIQTSGDVHLGNYLGAIKRWVNMQDQYDSFIFLADLHAITVDQDPKQFNRSIIEAGAALVASGIDPQKTTFFAQSHVRAHAECAWLFNCVTPLGWLNRMTQFKDKAGKNKENSSAGLYTYPVLQAADILLYNPDFVPVGEDQKQHVELTRDIAGAINRKFGKEILKMPEPIIPEDAPRIKSLKDGTKKMSKSDPSDASRINLKDDKDTIYDKLKRAKTDSIAQISYDEDERPEIANLLTIYSTFSDVKIDDIVREYEGAGFAKFKEDLAELVSTKMEPITNKYNELRADPEEMVRILKIGAEKASEVADATLSTIKKEFGFWD
jgi:tryptophanyl-tRNA synthetase